MIEVVMDWFAPSWRSDPPFITGVACRPQRKVRADRNAKHVPTHGLPMLPSIGKTPRLPKSLPGIPPKMATCTSVGKIGMA